MHFGASKPQISLHTGVMHYVANKQVHCESFCTTSDNIDHMSYANAVWAHMQPTLKKAAKYFPDTWTIILFSDSPSYSTEIRKFYGRFSKTSCSSHGISLIQVTVKGAMEEVGGSLKRNADKHILHGKDIMSAKDLCDLFKSSSTHV